MIIAEIAQAHDGSLGIAHSYIDALAGTGIDAVKFQTHIADAESSLYEPFRVNFSYEDKTRFDYWKRMEFTLEQWIGLKKHCNECGLEFISSPFSNVAVDLLEEVGVMFYKIGSGEVNNYLMLDKIASTGKHIILSSGMSNINELDETVDFLRNRNAEFSILQCTTSYPTIPEEWGLNIIQELKKRYNVKIGFSDHSGDIAACTAAAALGAEIFEFHAIFDRRMFGPDAKASLTIDQIKQLVHAIKSIQLSLKSPVDKKNNKKFFNLKTIFEKSLAINKDLPVGHIITFNDLEAKKPKGKGINAKNYMMVLGKELNKPLRKWSFLNENDLNE